MDRYKCEDLSVHSSSLDLSFIKYSKLMHTHNYI